MPPTSHETHITQSIFEYRSGPRRTPHFRSQRRSLPISTTTIPHSPYRARNSPAKAYIISKSRGDDFPEFNCAWTGRRSRACRNCETSAPRMGASLVHQDWPFAANCDAHVRGTERRGTLGFASDTSALRDLCVAQRFWNAPTRPSPAAGGTGPAGRACRP